MLTVKPLGTSTSDISHYYEALSKDDYYEAGSEPHGRWHGGLSNSLGLTGEIGPNQLRRMFEGFHPQTGDPLAANAGEKHRSGYDLTFSAPKSVSVAWSLADQELQTEIAAAHDAAVRAALDYLERNAFSSRDRGESRMLKGILAATYQHSTSREQDPQLHTHCAVANMGMRDDGTVCAIDFSTHWKLAGGSVYRVALSHQLKQRGFGIERDGTSFRLNCIPEPLCKIFSKRRSQILDYIEQTGFNSAKSRDIAALATRRQKESPDRSLLQASWQREAMEAGYSPEALFETLRCVPPQMARRDAEPFNLEEIIADLTRTQAVITRPQLEAAIAIEAQGRWGADELPNQVEQAIRQALENPEPHGLIRLNPSGGQRLSRRQTIHYTTRQMLQLEQECLSAALSRKDERHHSVELPERLLQGLSQEQADAVKKITQSSGGLCAVVGIAGSGKSFMLSRAREAFEEKFVVLGAALAGRAAESLEQGSGIPSVTLHSLLADLERGRLQLTNRHVIVLDEAGMIGTKAFHTLTSLINAAGSKLVAIGDPKQIQAIEAGGIFRAVSDTVGYASLTEIRRQESVEDRDMIHKLMAGQSEEVIEQLTQAGQLVTSADDQIIQHMVNDWYANRDADRPGESLMLSGTKADATALNLYARSLMKDDHRLHSEVLVSTEHGERDICVGERLMFTRNNKELGVKNGMLGTLVGWHFDSLTSGLSLTIELDTGKTIEFDPADYGHLEYGYAVNLHKAQGLTVDNANILLTTSMLDREWAYVACSRHRKRLRVFSPESMGDDLTHNMARSRQKNLASDFAFENMTRNTAPMHIKEAELAP